jgi:hypothetical protein
LSNELLLKILLRHREHYLAFEIYQYLKKDQSFRIKIFVDWACCKVESKEPDEKVCEDIRLKLSQEKGISFTEIAFRALAAGRSKLAMDLLEFELSLAKKVPLLLWMGITYAQCEDDSYLEFFERAQNEALRSKDLNLLFLAIRKTLLCERMQRHKLHDKLKASPDGRSALLNYYRLFDTKGFMDFSRDCLEDMEGVIMEYLRYAFMERNYKDYQKLLFCATEEMEKYKSTMKEDWRKQTLPKMYKNLCLFINQYPQITERVSKIKPITISKQL